MALQTLPANGVLVPQSTGRPSPAQYALMAAGKHLYFYEAPLPPYRGHSGAAARNYHIAAANHHSGYSEVGSSAKFYAMGGNARFPNFTAWDNFYSQWDAQSQSGFLNAIDKYVVPAVEIGVTGAVLAGFAPAITGGSGAASMTPEAAGSGGAGGGGGWAGTVENALGTVKGVISGGLTLKSILSGQPAQPSPQNQQAVPVNQAAPFKVTPAEAGFGLGGLLLLLIFIL